MAGTDQEVASEEGIMRDMDSYRIGLYVEVMSRGVNEGDAGRRAADSLRRASIPLYQRANSIDLIVEGDEIMKLSIDKACNIVASGVNGNVILVPDFRIKQLLQTERMLAENETGESFS